ncbi:MAG: hypothetical protein JNK72_22675 [Myxococcales bacterium]|nr:hypothetical protein [Myxococcales bacterium]
MATLAQLQQQFNEISGSYDAQFAGQSRVTRSLEDLNSLLNRIRSLATELAKLPRGKDRDALATDVKDTVLMFENERKEIMKAKSQGDEFVEFDALRTEANLTFAVYHRHFAGKSRNTRDLGLLGEMIEDLERIEEEMVALGATVTGAQTDIDVVRENLKMYRAERGEIVESVSMGTADEQASTLAEVANGQFKLYDTHFAGKSRSTRRPELIQRMIDSLVLVGDKMRALEGKGLNGDYNSKNIGIVEESLRTYRTELEEIRKSRQGVSFQDLQGQLGNEANAVFEEYRLNYAGKDRRTRDLDLLSNICDKLAEVGRQMALLGRAEPTDMNDRNLQIVTDQRVLFEREYTAIEDAKAGRTRTPAR